MDDEERKQSPHYIPELDPDNPKSGPKNKQRFLWSIVITAVTMMTIGVGLILAGYETVGTIVAIIGFLLLATLFPFGPF